MRYWILLLIFIFGCKTTKRIESSKVTDKISFEKEFKSGLDQINRTEDLAEITTKTTRTRTTPYKKESGEEVLIQEQVVEERTEKFNKTEESGTFKTETNTEKDLDQIESVYDLDRETEGQEVAKDISEGITQGLFKALFGDLFKNIALFVAGIIVIVFLIKMRKKNAA